VVVGIGVFSRSEGHKVNPELLRHASADVSQAIPTLDGLRKKTSTAAWAWCVTWLKRRHAKGKASSHTDVPVEWLSARELKVLCT